MLLVLERFFCIARMKLGINLWVVKIIGCFISLQARRCKKCKAFVVAIVDWIMNQHYRGPEELVNCVRISIEVQLI